MQNNLKKPIKIAITGAAGQIAYSILFRIASGNMLGLDQPVILQLLDLEVALPILRGVEMELNDCAYPLLHGITISSDPYVAFNEVDAAILIGSRPRAKGMERKDLLQANGEIFSVQGQALSKVANPDAKVLVVGNPANTNALITLHNAPNLKPYNITSMMRLDHNRAISQLASKLNVKISDIKQMIVWGNHSLTQYPDVSNVLINNQKAMSMLEQEWLLNYFVPTVQKRGATVIEARGSSSAASAASAAIDHMRDLLLGSKDNWVTMGVLSDGSYNIPSGIIYGFPFICHNTQLSNINIASTPNNPSYTMIKDLHIDELTHERMQLSYQELIEERDAVRHLLK